MDRENLLAIAEASSRFESAIARLYLQISRSFAEDRDFWLQLYCEEKNHAAIFSSFAIGELPLSLLPVACLDTDLGRIHMNIALIEETVENFDSRCGTRDEAYSCALDIEKMVGEAIFQDAIALESDSEALYFIQRINKDDRDHQERIERKMKHARIRRRQLGSPDDAATERN